MHDFFPFLRFSYEIELIPVKFLCDSCEIPTFQTGPKDLIGFPMRHPRSHRHTLAEMEQTWPSQALHKVRNADGFGIPRAMFDCYFCVIRDRLN